jgi:hypothetical protein
MADPKVWWRGKKFDKTTAQALAEAERLFGKRLVVTQGSFSNGRLSAGTHGGPGAVDLSVRGLSVREQHRLTKILRQVGFAAWLRTRADGFAPHIHGIRIGTPGLPRGARNQVEAFKRGRNGLSSNRADRQAWLKVKPTTWGQYLQSKKAKLPVRARVRGGVRLVNLRAGKKNSDVKALQLALRKYIKARGYDPNKYNPAGATGMYGAQTEKLVDIANSIIAKRTGNAKWASNSNKAVGPAFAKHIGLPVAG